MDEAVIKQKMADADVILSHVRDEIERAIRKHRSYGSAHEAWAVMREEVDELWDEVKADAGYTRAAFAEAHQVAAVAVRYVLDLHERLEP